MLKTGKFEEVFAGPFIKEFVLKSKIPVKELQKKLIDGGFFAALETEEGYVSFCVTEKRTKAEVDALLSLVREA